MNLTYFEAMRWQWYDFQFWLGNQLIYKDQIYFENFERMLTTHFFSGSGIK